MLYGIVPINKTMAGVLGAVVALLALAVVGVTVAWRLSVTRSRKSYKKWNEEVREVVLVLVDPFPLSAGVVDCTMLPDEDGVGCGAVKGASGFCPVVMPP